MRTVIVSSRMSIDAEVGHLKNMTGVAMVVPSRAALASSLLNVMPSFELQATATRKERR
jgi:hypothetical protein